MKQKDFLILLVPAFLITIVWVIFNIYHSSVDSTISDPLEIQITPIKTDFDDKAIGELKSRTDVDPLYEFLGDVAQPSPTPIIQASPSPSLQNEEFESSSEGSLTP